MPMKLYLVLLLNALLATSAFATPFWGVDAGGYDPAKITDPVLDAKNKFEAGDYVFLYIDYHAVKSPLKARIPGKNEAPGDFPGLTRSQVSKVQKRHRVHSLANGWRFVDMDRREKDAAVYELKMYANRFNRSMWKLIQRSRLK